MSRSGPGPGAKGQDKPRKGDNVVTLAWHRYLASLAERPVQTKALTAASLGAVSDITAQLLASRGRQYFWRRTVAVSLFGLVWTGPASHFWHKHLEKAFHGRRDANAVAMKVLLENLTMGPLTNLLALLYLAVVVEGRPWRAAKAQVGAQFGGVQAMAWRLWPLVSLLNHRFVAVRLRVLTTNLVSLFWSTFLILRARVALAATKV